MTPQPVPVLCLPYAGAGASIFHKWRQSAPADITLVPVQLPGREERTAEDPYQDLADAVQGLLADALDAVKGCSRVALFGHSLGAVLAYELARVVEERTELPVAHVFVSGAPGPHHGRSPQASTLNDDEFLARVEELAGYRHPAFDFEEFRELMLPTLRADVAMHEAYRPMSNTPISAPVSCLRGNSDTLVSERDAKTWRTATTGRFRYCEMPGDHMYITESTDRVLRLMAETLGGGTQRRQPAEHSTRPGEACG